MNKENVLRLVNPLVDSSTALGVIDDLRESQESGKIKAFICVGITTDHETIMWAGASKPTTRLEILGAISNLQHNYLCGE